MELKELLELRGIEYRKTNNPLEILISCTSGEHEDNTPSLSFNLEKIISAHRTPVRLHNFLNDCKKKKN